MKKENITRMTLEEALQNKGRGKTDWAELDRLEKAGIEPERDPEEGEIDWSSIQFTMPLPKQPVTLRLDGEIINFFKISGKGYQTRINAVLRSYVRNQQEKIATSS